MSIRMRIGLIIVLCLAQLAIPAYMIGHRENILRNGDVLNLQCKAFNPYDKLRGRYVSLDFEEDTMPRPPGIMLGQELNKRYLTFTVDEYGLAHPQDIHEHKPAHGTYLPVKIWGNDTWTKHKHDVKKVLRFQYPCRRYYVNEESAKLLRKYSHMRSKWHPDGVSRMWASLRVLNGEAVVENLWYDGVPLHDYLLQLAKKAEQPAL